MLFRNRRRDKLDRDLKKVTVPRYADSLSTGSAQEVLNHLIALHGKVRTKAGRPHSPDKSLNDRIKDLNEDLMSMHEVERIRFLALQHLRGVRDRGGSTNGDEVLAEQFVRQIDDMLLRVQRCYNDVL